MFGGGFRQLFLKVRNLILRYLCGENKSNLKGQKKADEYRESFQVNLHRPVQIVYL